MSQRSNLQTDPALIRNEYLQREKRILEIVAEQGRIMGEYCQLADRDLKDTVRAIKLMDMVADLEHEKQTLLRTNGREPSAFDLLMREELRKQGLLTVRH